MIWVVDLARGLCLTMSEKFAIKPQIKEESQETIKVIRHQK